ncbi:MAG: gliding motility-associated C-terminal domain-containing protein [Chryseolinea sp.]
MVTKGFKLLAFIGLFLLSYKTYAQPVFTIQNIKGACEGSPNGSFDVLVTSATGPINIFVFGPPNQGPISASLNVPVTITGLAGAISPGKSYFVVVQDVSSSSQNVSIVTYPSILSSTLQNAVNNSDCLVSNGSIDITPSGGSGAYTYSWVESSLGFSANTEDISGLLGGNYVLTLADLNSNCVHTFPPINITDPSPVIFNVTPTGAQIVCSGSSVTINLSGSEAGVNYEVYRNNVTATGITQVGTGGALIFSVPFGSFSNGDNFKIRASSGICKGDMNGIVVANITALPTASISGTTAICSGGSTLLTFTLPSSGTFDVAYSDGTSTFNANGISNGATVSVGPTANTTYTIVSVTSNATGCSSIAPSPNITGSAVVTINPLPTASISGNNTICPGGTTSLTFALPVGTYNVVYTDGTTSFNANGITNGATVNASPSTTTTYTIVSVTNVATTCNATAPSANITGSAIVTVNPLPTASISGTTNICSGGSVSLTFTLSAGTFDVVYTDGTTNFTATGITNGATVNVSPTANTTYTIVSVTNTSIASCTVNAPSPNITGNAIISVNPSPTASISGTSAICTGGNTTLTFTLSSTGTYDVVYTDGTTNFNASGISNGATVSVNPAVNTTYTIVSVTNPATTCASIAPSPNITGSAVVTVNSLPTADISGTTAICLGASTNLTFTLPAGTYNIVFTDGTTNFNANGLINGATISVSPTLNTTYTIVSVTNVATTCTATAPSPNITGNATISVNPLPTASISGGATICAGASATLTFTLPPGTYDVVYTDGTTTTTATGISNGATISVSPASSVTYTITSVTNTATSCTVTAPSANISGSAPIAVNPLPIASISGTSSICVGASATLTFTLPAGTYNLVYTDGTTNFPLAGITNGATVSVNPTSNTAYTIISVANTITSCSVTAPNANITGTAVITVSPLPTASISGTAIICQGDNATLTFTLTSPGTFNVVYSDGTTNFTANGIANGATVSVSPAANITYSIVSVTNVASSCTVTAPNAAITGSAIITVTPTPTANISGTTAICAGGNATLTFTLPATGTYDVVYSDGTTNVTATGIVNGATVSVSPATTTTYTIVSITTNGSTCTVTAPNSNITGSAVISVSTLPTASISGTATICQGQNATLTFTLPATGTYNVVYTDGTTNFNANGIVNGATVSVSPAANISYTIVSVSNVASTCSVAAPSPNISGSANITVTPPNSASIAGTATICAGASTNLTFTLDPGIYDVIFTDGTTNFTATAIATGATVSVSPSASTTYTILSIANTTTGCTVTAPSPNLTGSAIITITPSPTASIGGTTTLCQGANATLTFTLPAAGTFNVVYTDGTTNFNANAIANGATVSVSPAATTTYTIVSVTDIATSCVSTAPSTNITGSAVITVNPAPTAGIAGTTTICEGQNATLTFTLPATGTYNVVYTDGTTNFNANAIVNGATVSVSPAANITYTIVSVSDVASSCTVTAPSINITGSAVITVTPANSASISGTATICSGSNANLGITLDPGVYDVTITDGITSFTLPGISNGSFLSVSPTATVTYSISSITNTTTGCAVTAPSPNITGSAVITVNPSPTGTMSGSTVMCTGSATNIKVDFTGTGPWSFRYTDGTTTFGPFASPFNSINIPVNPTTTTTFALISVNDATACPGVINGNATVTVNQPPLTNLAVGATINPLCNGGISDVTVANSQAGVSYQLRNNAGNANIGTPVVGTGGTINLSTGALTATTTFNVLATAGGCTPAQLTNTVTINVAGSINAALAVTSDADPICSGSGANILVASSENGVLYQLRNDATNALIGSAVAGTGASISLPTGTLTTTTTFNVLASNGTCSIELTDTETINVGAAPDATLAVGISIDPLCAGGVSDVTVALSQNGVSYQLRDDADDSNVGIAVIGTGGTISLSTGVLNATTTFNVFATSVGCAAVELTATAKVNVTGAINAGLTVSAAADPICANSGTDIQIDLSETGVSYQLRDNATNALVGSTIAGTGATILLPTGNLAATTAFNILASSGTCSIVLTNKQTVNVDVAPDPTLTVGATLNPLCVGGTSDVTIAISQLGVSYQLRDDSDDSNVGTAVAGTGGTISLPTGVLNVTTTFNVLATSGICAAVELTNLVTINVSGTLNSALTVSASAASICAGSGTFVQVQASENGVSYQLRDDATDAAIGSPFAGNGATINLPTGNLAATTTFNIIATNGTCSIELSNKQTITVNPAPNLALGVSSSPAIICPANSSSIVVANSEVGISYQLRNNVGNVLIGGPIAGTGSNLSLSTGPLSSTTIFNVLAIAGTCSAQLTGTATVSVRLAGDPACGGGGGGSDCTNFSAIVPTIVTQPSCNDRDAGIVSFTISRADATPTTFRVIWTYNGGTPQTKFTSSTVAFNDLSSGLYQYTIIDEGNGKTCGPVDFFLDLKTQVHILTKQVTSNVTCYGGTDGNAILSVDGTTTGEYWYKYVLNGTESSAQTFTPGAPLPGGLPADDNAFIILKVDDNFNFTCPDTVMIRIKHTNPKILFTLASTNVTTCNGTDGGIQVTAISGGDSGTTPLQIRLKRAVPFSTDPSGYMVVSDFEDVVAGAKSYSGQPQGNYIVDIRDHLDCIQSKPIAIQAPGQVPLSSVSITAADANCANNGQSGSIRVSISDAGIYKVALSQDQVNTPADAEFIDYNSPSLPSVTFNNLASGVYYLYLKSSITTCPTRTDAIIINGVKALADFEVLSNCENVNLTMNNITGQQDAPFVIRVFNNNDKFFKIDSLAAGAIPISNSVSFNYAAAQHTFLVNSGTYRFVMIQTQTTGTGSCVLVSDTVVYQVRELLSITLGQITPSFPAPKHTGSIQIANISGGTRFVSTTNSLYYEIQLTTADDDIVVVNWTEVKLDPQNKFIHLFDYLPQGVYTIKVRDAAGCVVTQVVEIPLDTSVYVPNMFTPNEDNVNDEFEVLNLPVDGNHKLIITNRWGNEVFKSNDYRNGNFWTGDGVSDGVYFYRLKVAGGDTFTGWVEIIRGSKP